jgi:hypothetical protein
MSNYNTLYKIMYDLKNNNNINKKLEAEEGF